MGLEFEVVAVETRTDKMFKHQKKGEIVAPWPIETVTLRVPFEDMQWAGPDKWGIEIAGHIHPDTDSRLCSIDDAPSPTKGEAIKTARAMLEHGFKLHPGLGWCAR